ncbi:hypothetical protein GCM10026982_10710 [Nocardiopsis aegyptia]
MQRGEAAGHRRREGGQAPPHEAHQGADRVRVPGQCHRAAGRVHGLSERYRDAACVVSQASILGSVLALTPAPRNVLTTRSSRGVVRPSGSPIGIATRRVRNPGAR